MGFEPMIIGSSPITPKCIAQLVEQWSLKPEVLGSSPNTPKNPSSNGRTLTFHVKNMSSILIGFSSHESEPITQRLECTLDKREVDSSNLSRFILDLDVGYAEMVDRLILEISG